MDTPFGREGSEGSKGSEGSEGGGIAAFGGDEFCMPLFSGRLRRRVVKRKGSQDGPACGRRVLRFDSRSGG